METTTIAIPEAVTDCACKRTEIKVLSATRKDSGVTIVTGHVVCLDCGEVQTQLTSGGYDDVFRLTFGSGLQEKMAAAREAKAAAKANRPAPPTRTPRPKSEPDPSKGLPGTEMLLVTSELGIEAKPGCGCKDQAAVMDRLGVEGCRRRSNELTLAIDAGLADWGWMDKLKMATAAAWKAVGMGVSVSDPVRSLLQISIDRAEAKIAKQEN